MIKVQYNDSDIERDGMIDEGVWALYNKSQLNAHTGFSLKHYFKPQRIQTWSDKVLVHPARSACGSYEFLQVYGYNYGQVALVLVPYNVSWYMTSMGAPAPITYFDAWQTPLEIFEDVENAIRFMEFPDGQQILIDMILDAPTLHMWRFERFMDAADNLSTPDFDEFDGPPDIDIMEDYIEFEEEWIEPPLMKTTKGKPGKGNRRRILETYVFGSLIDSK